MPEPSGGDASSAKPTEEPTTNPGAPVPATPPAAEQPPETAPSSPAGAPSPEAQATPEPAAPSTPPDPAPRKPDRVRTNLKVAGAVMVLMGLLTLWQGYGANQEINRVFGDAEVAPFSHLPGGNLTVHVAGADADSPAQVTVWDYNGTELARATTDAQGSAALAPGRVALRVHVEWQGSSWDRKAIAIPNFDSRLTIDPAKDPATLEGWRRVGVEDLQPTIWATMALGAAIAAAGVLAFRMKARRLAMAGAILFLVASLALAYLSFVLGQSIFQPILFVAIAAFAIWAIVRAWDRFGKVPA